MAKKTRTKKAKKPSIPIVHIMHPQPRPQFLENYRAMQRFGGKLSKPTTKNKSDGDAKETKSKPKRKAAKKKKGGFGEAETSDSN